MLCSIGVAITQSRPDETIRHYLSGTGFDDAIAWDFTVTDGRRAGEATTIPVPSVWEQHGFGSYNYGHDEDKASEQGRYRHTFEVPEGWRDRHVELVFDGVMTDAEVTVNGRSAGPLHQGAFYRFRYDVTQLLSFGEENVLEVLASKQSANRSVNLAERDADYWVFGGIFRPVFLEVSPRQGIDRIAVDTRHAGAFSVGVFTRGVVEDDAQVRLQFEPASGALSVPAIEALERSASVVGGDRAIRLTGRAAPVEAWSAEHPNLYRATVELLQDGKVLHRVVETVGFRTIEARPREGLFVNGHRVLLKGVNRHSFWPDSGRTLTDELNRRDAELIKAMNLNAVRMSHYPPDPAFLDACDELGLYVINELGGWHDAYDFGVGRKLVREMVERDVNHPSIIMWANGNEGGHNFALDSWFGDLDPQDRIVLRPRSHWKGFETMHYPTFEELRASLDETTRTNQWRELMGEMPLVMPTEMLHGLYEGGSGAGLEDFWSLLSESPYGIGGFLWAFTDEAIVRTDLEGELDTDGNHAPDGILGPYRERTGNFYAVRAGFAPLRVEARSEPFDGWLRIRNLYDMTNLSEVTLDWEALALCEPCEETLDSPDKTAAPSGTVHGPSAGPGETAALEIPLPSDDDFGHFDRFNAVRITARDRSSRELGTWVFPTATLPTLPKTPETEPRGSTENTANHVTVDEGDGLITMQVIQRGQPGARVSIDKTTGRLTALGAGSETFFSWTEQTAGPRPSNAEPAGRSSTRWTRDANTATVEVSTDPDPEATSLIHSMRWTLTPTGWLKLEIDSETRSALAHHGLVFGIDRDQFHQLRWLGNGPFRVWANRRQGATLGLWSRSSADPEVEGFYSGVHWAELTVGEHRLTLYLEGAEWLGLFSPTFPEDARTAIAEVSPFQGFGVYHAIPGIGTKFNTAGELGPQGLPSAPGRFETTVWLKASAATGPASQ